MTKPDKLELQSADVTRKNIEALAALFPHIVTEGLDDYGNLVHQVNFEALRQELSDYVVEGKEVYQIDWPGKLAAEFASNAPIEKTLRPNLADSVDFDTTKNLFIEGDNLEALKLLQESYLGKVRLIYIDPPYNTGGDLVYRDDFSSSTQEFLWKSRQVNEVGEKLVSNTEANGRFHSDWLSMIYPRLRLAKRFLASDGVILVSIDDAEQASLRRLMDEVFGEQNFIAQLVWEKGRKNDAKFFSVGHEYLVVYAKSKSSLREQNTSWREEKPGAREVWDEYLLLREAHGADDGAVEQALTEWYKGLPKSHPAKKLARTRHIDANGPWRDDNISWPGGGGPRYDVIHPVTGQPCAVPEAGWRYGEDEMKRRIALGLIVFRDDHTQPPFRKSHLRPIAGEVDDVDDEGGEDTGLAVQVRGSYFYKQSQVSVRHLRNLMGAQVFNNPKDHEVLSRLFEYVLGGKGGVVMDFFAGSATTAEAVFDLCARTGLNCPVILVQLPELLEDNLKSATGSAKTTIQNAIKLLQELDKPLNIAELTKIRIQRAGAQVLADRKPSEWNGDIGFRAFTIDTSNFTDITTTPDAADQETLLDLVESVKTDRSGLDVLFEVMIAWGLNLAAPINIETLEGREVYSVEDGALLACFDDRLDEALIRALALRAAADTTQKVVFKDTGFASDDAAINAHQVFEQLSPDTTVKVI
ncbi:site-specific DNA-methyltransferase [Microbacterium limosum]|uniref:Site-specific DNA-methyltransferase n=1 Tax=Microbacterium limosum TaxID=3079935 RepID=A0AAU0ML65_9MICO|nr:site-specific DNA-methyltransferase [Microbacterium sp. Y20]WOQ70738.1 site-specific DNA-methyltransferase [Microbacterium sp. Y20]